MPSAATAPLELPLESDANIEFYRLRDNFIRAYKPATEEQKLLVIQMSRAWKHLQEVYELRDRLTAQKGLLGLFEEDFEKYRFLLRNLTEAERMWRHAHQAFEKAHRRRDNLASPRRSNVSAVPSFRPAPPSSETARPPQPAPPDPAPCDRGATHAKPPTATGTVDLTPLPKNST